MMGLSETVKVVSETVEIYVGRRVNWFFERSSSSRLVRALIDEGSEEKELERKLRVIRPVISSSSSGREDRDKSLMLRRIRPLNRAKEPGAMYENLLEFTFRWVQVLTDDVELVGNSDGELVGASDGELVGRAGKTVSQLLGRWTFLMLGMKNSDEGSWETRL